MANDCTGTMRVVATTAEAIDRFERIMKYEDPEYFCYRVRGFDAAGSLEEDANTGLFAKDFFCDSAWSSGPWFEDKDEPSRLIVKWFGGNGEEIYGTAHYTTIPHLCRVLGMAVEMWSTEPGCQFEEHGVCHHNGVSSYETAVYIEEFPKDENGDCIYTEEPVERHGFGDDFGAFMSDADIFYGDYE